MQFLIRKSAILAGFAFPQNRSFVSPPTVQMPIDAVDGDVELTPDEPFCKWWIPLQHFLPLLEPVQLSCDAGPEFTRIFHRKVINFFVLSERFDIRLSRKFRRRLEDS